MATQQSRTFQLQDLLSNAGDGKDDENLSVNDGRIGTYIEEHKIFITMPNGSFIPRPPTATEILLHEDGRFGHHDPTHAPQFFDAKFCHFSVIPHHLGPKDDTHPYRNWLDTIWYDVVDADIVYSTGYLTHISLLSQEVHSRFQHAFNYINECSSATRSSKRFSEEFNGFLGIWCARLKALVNRTRSVMTDSMTIRVQVAAMQSYWLDNQVILKAEEPVVFPLNTSLPSPPFPVIYKGDPSHPQKFYAMHRFTQIFNTYRNPFNFVTVSQSSVVHAERTQAAASSSLSISVATGHLTCNQRGKARALGPLASAQASQKKKQTSNQQQDKFTNLVGTYAPSLIPAWADAIAKIDKFSERSQEREEHSRLSQSQSDKEGPIAPSHVNGYIFPDPALLVYASTTWQSSFFRQWEHCRDALIYCVTSSSSNAKPLRPQLWRELLAMAFKSGNAQGTKVHNLMAQALGSALEAPSSGTTILQAPAPVNDQPVDVERGKYLVWELCELNFRQELLSLDMHLTHPDSSAKEEDVINFRLKRQEQIMGLFSDGSLVPSMPTSTNRLALPTWSERFEALKSFRDVMQAWDIPLSFASKGHLGPLGSEVALRTEAALVAHYAQTFFDVFGWPPADYSCLSTTLSLALFFIVMQYYFLRGGLQRVDPFFSDTQQMYRRSSSLHDDYPVRVLLEVEMRYVNVLTQNGVQKLSIFSGWHSSRQNRDNHYTLRGYNRQGWMVVTLEMKARNAGKVFEYGCRAHRWWLFNARRNRCSLAPRHVFRVREHVETPSVEFLFYKLMYDTVSKLGKIGIGYLVYRQLSTYQTSGLDMVLQLKSQ
ncbi:hypothetical protein IW262DRAFT_1464895 [Armillaria fumosa]|nr:hypothetical protein IW262DRAFT_1464895 [Armillaria fumosa]